MVVTNKKLKLMNRGNNPHSTTVSSLPHDTCCKISLIIPTLNESQSVPDTLSRIPKVVDEVIIVDAYSKDNTVELARKILPTAKIMYQKRHGKGDALRHGFELAKGEIVVQMDADGSMDPIEIEKFVKVLSKGYDVVKGSRYLPGGGSTDLSTKRSFGNVMFVKLVNLLFSSRYTDLCYGYMGFKKEALKRLRKRLKADGFEVETEICIKARKLGLKVAEVPSFEGKRIHGTSHLHFVRDGLHIFLLIVLEFLKTGEV